MKKVTEQLAVQNPMLTLTGTKVLTTRLQNIYDGNYSQEEFDEFMDWALAGYLMEHLL